MPTYGYQCNKCKHEFSVFQSMKDDAISTCPECAGTVKRLLYPVGIVFKGSGWYINDSRKPDKSESAPETPKPSEKPDSTAPSTGDSAPKADSGAKSEASPKAEPAGAAK